MERIIDYDEYLKNIQEANDNLNIQTKVEKRQFVLKIITNTFNEKFILSKDVAKKLYDEIGNYLKIF